MREILFKAKSENSGYSPETNGWVEGDLVHSIAGDRYINGDIKVDPETVCEYSGKTDSEGKRIFENDILRISSHTLKEIYTAVVRFGEYGDSFHKDRGHIGFYLDFPGDRYFRKDLGFWLESCEVVVAGNIFDHPGL